MDPSPFANHRYINFKGGGLLHTSANGGDGDVRGDGGSDGNCGDDCDYGYDQGEDGCYCDSGDDAKYCKVGRCPQL